MIHKKQFTDIAKKIIRTQRGLQNHQLMHPGREWIIGLCVAAILFTGSAVWSSITYLEHKDGELLRTQITEEQPAVYREALVAAALELYEAKNTKLNTLLNNSPEIIPEVVQEVGMSEEVSSSTVPTEVEQTTSSTETGVESESVVETEPEIAEEAEEASSPGETVVVPAISL